MALVPASCQGKPLRDSYRHFGESYGGGWQRYAEQMIEVIPFIEGVCADHSVWGLLSHFSLLLLAVDDWRSPKYVMVSLEGDWEYAIRYKAPSRDLSHVAAPARISQHWEDVGLTRSPAAAAELVHTAMVKSGGWPDLR